MTEPRTHHAGNQRPNKSRQCTAHVAKRAERHDSAVEGEHERDQWSRNEIRAEFAGHLLYPPTRPCLSSREPIARPSRRRDASPRIAIAPSARDCRTAGVRSGLSLQWVISKPQLSLMPSPLRPSKQTSASCPRRLGGFVNPPQCNG